MFDRNRLNFIVRNDAGSAHFSIFFWLSILCGPTDFHVVCPDFKRLTAMYAFIENLDWTCVEKNHQKYQNCGIKTKKLWYENKYVKKTQKKIVPLYTLY